MFLILSEYKDQSWKYYFVDKLFASYFSLFMTDEHILTFFVSLFTKKMWCKWCSSEAPQIMSAFSFLDALEVSQQLTQSLTLSNDSEDNEN